MRAVFAERRMKALQRTDFNKIIITGYANSEPKLGNTANGTPVLNFQLLSFMKRRSDVFSVTVWGDLAQVAALTVFPNDKLLIEGHIQHKRTSENKQSDFVEVVAKRIYSIGNDSYLKEYKEFLEF